MAAKMNPKFIALCTIAVGAIYSSGYAISASAQATTPAPQVAVNTPNSSDASQTQNTSADNSNNSSADGSSQNAGTATSTGGSSKPTKSTTATKPSSNTSSPSSTHSTTSTKPTKPAVKPQQKYLDGTYDGSAYNRIGSVSVAVTIKQGKIANVQITACDTHYPEGYIDPVLPQYVVAHQSTDVPVVSGATLSTENFYYATVEALQKAHNPNYHG